MDIKGISGNITPDSVGHMEQAAKSAKVGRGSSSGSNRSVTDRVDMSELSAMMSKGARNLHDNAQPRPGKVAEFQQDIDKPVALSDQVIDTIFKRMAGV
jgi:hypothetical protein